MTDLSRGAPISRRRVLAIGGGVAAGLVIPTVGAPSAGARDGNDGTRPGRRYPLPSDRMQAILEAEGSVMNGVLRVSVDRDDIQGVTLRGVPIKPAFEINGDLTFQPLGFNQAFFNGDLPLKASEVNPVIDAILASGLVFQAEHQHFYDFEPPVWFIHFRGRGKPLALATAVHAVMKATSTPLPQHSPANPTTPFDKDRLRKILHGYSAEVGNDGVVTVSVARRDQIRIEGIRVSPQTNISTTIGFQALDSSGSNAAVAPDFGMVAREINPVVKVMRGFGWDIGCLYNQETDERPQLYFSHQFKTGDPYRLAQEIRRGLDETDSQ